MGSGNEIVDYSRAPCLGADQKTHGLRERDCWLFQSSVSWCWPKGTWAVGTRLLIIPELRVLVLTKRHEGSGDEIVDYSRAKCLGADQKTRGLWERDCWLFQSSMSWCWPKDTWAQGTRLLIIPELHVLVLTKRHEGSGNEIVDYSIAPSFFLVSRHYQFNVLYV